MKNISLATTAGASELPDDDDGNAPRSGLAGGAMLSGENRILFEVTETPFDAPSDPGVSRIACARTRFDASKRLKFPASGIFQLPPDAFKPADEFNAATDCVQP